IEHLTLGSSVVSGSGVIGEQPILGKNESFEYISGCELWNPYGRMSGFYTFLNRERHKLHLQLLSSCQLNQLR
ncbi:MAG: ApaG domain, partial [Crocinitomicaceae bacterium]|nr:ApaG domain [Crocinitomicaceae bacterium]